MFLKKLLFFGSQNYEKPHIPSRFAEVLNYERHLTGGAFNTLKDKTRP